MRYELFGQTPTSGQWRWSRDNAEMAIKNYEEFLVSKESDLSLDEYYLDHYLATNEKLKFVRLSSDNVVQYYVPPSTGQLLSDNWMDITLSGSETDQFDTEKNVALLERMVSWISDGDDIVLDFFSGSGTTANAVININLQDHNNRRFIMVQLPAIIPAGSVRELDVKTLCDIGEERIRRAGKKIVAEIEGENRQLKIGEDSRETPDIGFRVLRIDSSNFRDTKVEPSQLSQDVLYQQISNLKVDRTPEDLLFQVLPAFRIPYSAKIEKMDIDSARCFNVNDGQLIACFDATVKTSAIEKIAQMKPLYAVFLDASFASDSDSANFDECFKTYSPDTVRRVI